MESCTHQIRLDTVAPEVLDDLKSQVDEARREGDDVDVAAADCPRPVASQVLLLARHRLLADCCVRFCGSDRELGDGHREAHDVRAATREADFRSGEASDDLVEASAGCNDVSRLAAQDVRFEDGAVAVHVVVRRKERGDLDILDPDLAAQSDDVLELLETFLRDMLEARSGRDDERTHLAHIAGDVNRPERLAHSSCYAGELEKLRRRLDPGTLQPAVLDEDVANGVMLLRRDNVEQGVEDLRVVDDVRGYAG